jgi:apolipoprotein N-acyltransferase
VNACLLAALSGALYLLAFPGFDLWPLAFVTFVPLLYVLDHAACSPRQAFGIGLVCGGVAQLLGFRWLVATLQVFSALPLWGTLLTFALICVYQAGQHALFASALCLAKRKGRDPLLLAPFCYTALERSYPMLFPSHFAASLHTQPLLLQSLDLGGPGLVSWAIVAINAALCAALRPGSERRPRRALGAATLAFALMVGYGFARQSNIERQLAGAAKLSVGIVQANMERLEKREAREEGRRRHVEQSQRLEAGVGRPAHGARAPDLLVWPETALQYVLPTELKSARAMLGPLTTPVLFGGLGHRIVAGRAQLYNSAFLADGDGRVLGRTDKMRLIPFAEYIPFGELVPRLYDWLPNSGQFTRGDRPRALVLDGRRIAALICYEDILPEFVLDVVRQTNPALLVDLSNDAWFGRSAEPYIHLALSKLRAIEHRRYLVRATNSGVSAIVDATGHVVLLGPLFTRESLRGQVALLSAKTVYRTLGDWPAWLGLAVTLLSLLPLRYRPRRQ